MLDLGIVTLMEREDSLHSIRQRVHQIIFLAIESFVRMWVMSGFSSNRI